jgi:UMF1 family MFS transporter
LGLCYPLLKGGFSIENQAHLQHTSVLTALFFLATGWPIFVFLRERAVPRPVAPGELWRAGWGRIMQTVRLIGTDRRLRTFFGAFFLYSCGVTTIIAFAAIYAEKEIGFGGQQLILFFLLLQISASVGAFLFGILQDRWGSIPTLRLTLAMWIGTVIAASLVHRVSSFYIVGNVAGLAIGSVQSASRAVVALLAPPDRHAEYFGFWGLFGKLAAGIGPLVYGLISFATHSSRLALLGPIAFFIVGGWLIGKVRLDVRTP